MSTNKLATSLATFAFLGSILTAQAGGTAISGPLRGEQIRALISGNTVSGPIYAKPYDFSYMAEGRVYGDIDSSTGNGVWRIRDGDRYCHEWSNFFAGVERCYQWYDVGNGRYRMVNVDSFRIRNIEVWRIKPGLE